MRMRPTPVLLLAGLATLAPLPAQQMSARMMTTAAGYDDRGDDRSARRAAAEFRRLKVPGEQVEANVRKLVTELRWHKSLRSALGAAQANGKPVVWIHALGDVDGFL